MTLAVGGMLSTYNQINKRKQNKKKKKKPTQFQHGVLRDNKHGNGLWDNFIESEAPKTDPRDQKKETQHCRIR